MEDNKEDQIIMQDNEGKNENNDVAIFRKKKRTSSRTIQT